MYGKTHNSKSILVSFFLSLRLKTPDEDNSEEEEFNWRSDSEVSVRKQGWGTGIYTSKTHLLQPHSTCLQLPASKSVQSRVDWLSYSSHNSVYLWIFLQKPRSFGGPLISKSEWSGLWSSLNFSGHAAWLYIVHLIKSQDLIIFSWSF